MKIIVELDNKDFRRFPAIRAFAKLIEELTENGGQETEVEAEAATEHKDEEAKERKELPTEDSKTVVTKTDKKAKTSRVRKVKAGEKLEADAAPIEPIPVDEPKEVAQEQEPAPKTEDAPISTITFEELKTTIMELNRKKSIARDLMSEFGIKCLSDIKPENYEKVINRAKELVA